MAYYHAYWLSCLIIFAIIICIIRARRAAAYENAIRNQANAPGAVLVNVNPPGPGVPMQPNSSYPVMNQYNPGAAYYPQAPHIPAPYYPQAAPGMMNSQVPYYVPPLPQHQQQYSYPPQQQVLQQQQILPSPYQVAQAYSPMNAQQPVVQSPPQQHIPPSPVQEAQAYPPMNTQQSVVQSTPEDMLPPPPIYSPAPVNYNGPYSKGPEPAPYLTQSMSSGQQEAGTSSRSRSPQAPQIIS
ncbi:hypothetical protein BGX27_002197 [Mortierella sp. AM989]|nr:hypothetical protein BGX27_002197 [Mortierella sp. AM989]